MTDDFADLKPHLRPYIRGCPGLYRIDAPHVSLSSWQIDAEKAGMTMGEIANQIDARESALARLAWILEEHEDYVYQHNHRFQLEALIRVLGRYGASLDDPKARIGADLGPAARLVWRTHGYHPNATLWRWLLAVLRRSGFSLMNLAERAALDAMPAELTLWRGFSTAKPEAQAIPDAIARGTSWSHDRAHAIWFSRYRHEAHQYLATATVLKASIAAYLADEKEFVVFDPAGLQTLSIDQLPRRLASQDLAA